MEKPAITPKTKVAELLKHYPELEKVLIEQAPEFNKLTNPILRRTVAKITSLEQAAAIAKIDLSNMINNLRNFVGQDMMEITNSIKSSKNDFEISIDDIIKETIDGRPIISSGGHPLQMVMQKIAESKSGEIIKLITPFAPIPMIDIAKERGFKICLEKVSENLYHTYFKK